MPTERSRERTNDLVSWACILACLAFLACVIAGCAAVGSAAGGAVVGAAVAGPPGAGAGAAGGLIGSFWTEIVTWWHGVWGWISGPDGSPAPHIPTVGEVIGTLFWWLVFGAAIYVGLKLLGSRYREMIWNAVKALFRAKPAVALKSLLAAEGVLHSGTVPVVQPRKTQDTVLDSVLPQPPEGDT